MPRSSCRHCGCQIFQGNGGIWKHLGRHGYENQIECRATTVAEPDDHLKRICLVCGGAIWLSAELIDEEFHDVSIWMHKECQ